MPNWSPGFSKCQGPRCGACRVAFECNTFLPSSDQLLRAIPFHLTCDTTGCVYVVQCSACSMAYVGQTSNPLRQRIGEHLRAIEANSASSPLARHFREVCSRETFSFFAIDRSLSTPSRLA